MASDRTMNNKASQSMSVSGPFMSLQNLVYYSDCQGSMKGEFSHQVYS